MRVADKKRRFAPLFIYTFIFAKLFYKVLRLFSTHRLMHQVVLELSGSRKVHVISEHPSKEEALDKYIKLVEANKGTPVTTNGKYTIRKKPE